jgi:hypothetical protein
MAAALLVLGALAEFTGIVLLGFPDFLPGALRLSAWLGHRGRRALNRIRRLIGLPPLTTHISIAAAVELNLAGSIAALVVSREEGTLEEKVDFLLRRDQDAQRRLNELEHRLDDLEAESPRRLDELRAAMEEHVAREVAAVLEAYRPLRIAGTIALFVGLVCITTATLAA